MAIEKGIVAAGELALGVAKKVAPEAAAEGVNLLAIAEKGAASVLPTELRALVHIGPKNGMVEISTSAETQIVNARRFEA